MIDRPEQYNGDQHGHAALALVESLMIKLMAKGAITASEFADIYDSALLTFEQPTLDDSARMQARQMLERRIASMPGGRARQSPYPSATE